MKIIVTVDTDQPLDVTVETTPSEISTASAAIDAIQRLQEKTYAARYKYMRDGNYGLDEEKHWNRGANSHSTTIYLGAELDMRVDAARFGEIPE